MQVLVSASQLDAANDLLEEVQASSFAPDSLTMHRTLLRAFRAAGDPRAAEVQAAIDRLGLA